MRKLRWCLFAIPLALGACDNDGACVPETDLAFCARQGFECGAATGFDNCEASRTVACGMCTGGQMCSANACVAGIDAGGPDAGGPDDAGGPEDAGAPDAGTCLAANGWPVSSLPAGYMGDGYAVGDRFPAFTDMVDQNGETDVSLGQFYGAMIVLAVHAAWNPPSVMMDATAQARLDTLNGATTDYVTVQLSVLSDDETPGGQMTGGIATGATASQWAMDRGGSFPVLAGMPAYQLSVDASVGSLPTIFILDPNLEVREVIAGWPGDMALLQSVRDAWTAFRGDNPAWTSTYCPE